MNRSRIILGVPLAVALLGLTGCGVMAHGKHAHGANHGANMEAFFALADSNGDGKLSAGEILAGREAMRERWAARAVEHHDADGDGLLSPEEAKGLRKAWHRGRWHH